MSTVVTGYYKDIHDLKEIAEYMRRISQSNTTAHHIWVDNIEDEHMFYVVDSVRRNKDVLDTIRSRFPGHNVMNVTDCDEVYYAVSPEHANNSDRFLVDCHYDAPFTFLPSQFGVRFYRVIMACNHNEDVQTTFPNDDISVTMDTGDFHGLDYNRDLHCVYGTIPKGRYRVLLKLHYIVYPKHMSVNSWPVRYVHQVTSWWTHISREIMRITAKPSNSSEYILSIIVNGIRFLYTHVVFTVAILFICVLLYALSKIYMSHKSI